MPLKSYRELEVWQRSMDLAEAVYKATRKWPAVERFGLISQAQRAAGSVPSSIAEGDGRLRRGDYVKHLSYARGSLMELETHPTLAVRVDVADPAPLGPVWTLAQRTGQMLNRLIDSLSTLDPDQPHAPPRRATRQTRKPASRA